LRSPSSKGESQQDVRLDGVSRHVRTRRRGLPGVLVRKSAFGRDTMRPGSEFRFRRFILATVALLGALALAAPASAVRTSVIHGDATNCDTLVVPARVDELGLGAASVPAGPFPAGEEITASATSTALTACGYDFNNVLVTMTNLTPFDFQEVWYVGDWENGVLNLDGYVDNAGGGVCGTVDDWCPAFRIDSAVSDPGGINQPLVFESMTADDVFQAGETWEFVIAGYFNTLGLPASALSSIGVGSASQGAPSSGSIIAVIPEPSTAFLLGFGLMALAGGRRRR
jgi:hypothetical protein